MFYNQRCLSIIFILLKQKEFISSSELSTLLNVSERTIKRDILTMTDAARVLGFEIEAKRGAGYRVEVIDRKLFDEFRSQLFSKYTHFDEISVSDVESRSEQLLKILLSSDRYLRIQDLSARMYLNERTISLLVNQIRPILEPYHLKLISKQNYGLRIEGDEIHRRTCMTDYYTYFIENEIEKSGVGSFETLLECDFETFTKVQQFVTQTIIKKNKKIENHKLLKLPYLIVISYNRSRKGKKVLLPDGKFDNMAQLQEFKIIEEIISRANTFFGYELPYEELLFLSLILFTYEDFHSTYMEPEYGFFFNEASRLKEELIDLLKSNTGLEFGHLEQFGTNLIIFLFPYYIKQHLQLVDTNRWRNYSRNYLRSFDHISIDLAILSAVLLRYRTNYMLCNDDIMQMAIIFNNAFTERSSENYDISLKIAIKADNNFRMVYNIFEYLQICKYKDYIRQIDLLHAYEIPETSHLLGYDMVFAERTLSNAIEFTTTLREKCFWLPDLSERENYYTIERNISQVIHQDMFRSYAPKDIRIAVNPERGFKSKSEVLDTIAGFQTDNKVDKQALKEYLEFTVGQPNVINVYPLKSSLKWNKKVVSTVIHLDLASLVNVTFLEFITRFYKKIVFEQDYLSSLMDKGSRNLVDEDYFEILS